MTEKKRKGFIINHQFEEDLYKDTLFVGELIRDDTNKFIFLIEDIIIYAGDNKNLMYKNLIKRHELINLKFY